MKSAVFAPLGLLLCTLALPGCESKQAPAADGKAQTEEGISVADARLVLPPVKGNPGAVYFTVHNDTPQDQTITAAAVKGAKEAMVHKSTMVGGMSEMHEMPGALVPANGTLAFAPGGLHVMAMDLDDSLAKGGTTEVTLTFESGRTAVFPAEILAAGDAR